MFSYLSLLSLTIFIDINECRETKESICFANSDCVNTVGSFDCVCRAGYVEENGTSCMSELLQWLQQVYSLTWFSCLRDVAHSCRCQ